MLSRRILLHAIPAVLLLTAFTARIRAQATYTGEVRGTVTDPDGSRRPERYGYDHQRSDEYLHQCQD